MDPLWPGILIVGGLGVAGMLRLFLTAMDPVTRLRDSRGREIDPAELEEDEPEELKDRPKLRAPMPSPVRWGWWPWWRR